jgi:hypothetical protein
MRSRAFGGKRIDRGNRRTKEKRAPVSLCLPQIPHELIWDWTRAAYVSSWKLVMISRAVLLNGGVRKSWVMKVRNHVVLLSNKRPQCELPALHNCNRRYHACFAVCPCHNESLSVTPPYTWVRPQKPFICYITQLPFSFCLPLPIIRKSNSMPIYDVIVHLRSAWAHFQWKSYTCCHSSILAPPIRVRYNWTDLYESYGSLGRTQDNTSLRPCLDWDSNR